MKDKQKIQLANLVLEFLAGDKENSIDSPIMVGILNKSWGMNGFKLALPGTPVFQKGDKYVLYIESLDGKVSLEVPFNKETLKPAINFTNEIKE